MINIIHEDAEIIVLNKKAGLITETNPFETSSETLTLEYLKGNSKRQKPFLGIIHRLDRVTSGVLVMAKKKSILKIWNKAFEEKKIQKEYLAISQNPLPRKDGILEHWHKKDQASKSAIISKFYKKGYKKCSLKYELLEEAGKSKLYLIKPLTGRYHQIRAQMAAADCPIIGDVKYGGQQILKNKIALHSQRLIAEEMSAIFDASPVADDYWINFETKKL